MTKHVKSEGLTRFEISDGDISLHILADRSLQKEAHAALIKCRTELDNYIAKDPQLLKTKSPKRVGFGAPRIVREIASAGRKAKLGPSSALIGAVAEYVGKELLKNSKEVVVDGGGKMFMKITKTRRVMVHAGTSPFSEKITLEMDADQTPTGICLLNDQDKAEIYHGKADAIIITSGSAALAESSAYAIGNVISSIEDIQGGLNVAKRIRGIRSILIIKGDHMGASGRMKIVAV
jgi:ApbE superfamily uncharacterized protein (UPF0280 family)